MDSSVPLYMKSKMSGITGKLGVSHRRAALTRAHLNFNQRLLGNFIFTKNNVVYISKNKKINLKLCTVQYII